MSRFAGLLLLILCGCDSGKPGTGRTDSESHWLEPCTGDAECGDLQCVCGVCTTACTAGGAECGGVGAEAACLALPASCGGVTACTRACDAPAQCGGDHLTCEGGACAPAAAVTDAGLTDARVPGDAAVDAAVPDAGPPPPITTVPGGPGCTGDADCPGGRCQAEGLDAQDQLCGQPAPAANVCQAEVCTRDADCGLARRCVRAGEHGFVRSACVPARCQADADCADRPGGACLGFFTPCHLGGFACAGDDDPCRVDADCPQRGAARVCLPRVAGGTECIAIE